MNLSQLNRVLRRMLLLPILALATLSVVFCWQIYAAVHTVELLQAEDRNIALSTAIGFNVINEETGVRGYQITGNEIFLQPYEQSNAPLTRLFLQLHDNLAALHQDTAPIDQIHSENVAWKRISAEPTIASVQAGLDTRDSGLNLRSKARIDAIREQLLDFSVLHRGLRDQAAERFQRTVRHTVIIAIGLALCIGLMIGVYSRSQLHDVSAAFGQALTALRSNAAEAEASARRLRTTLTSIGDAVVVTDIAGHIEMLNPVAERLTGWRLEEALHKPIDTVFQMVDETTREPLESPVSRVLRERRAVSMAKRSILLSRTGAEFPIDDSGAPILDAVGNLTGIVMVFRDVTEQRQTQSALLATEKLAVAGRLAATIAHEIHNPLDAVINLLYLLRSDPDPEERQQFLAMASEELDRVAQISRSMLGMYRESKTPVALDLGALIASLLLLLERNLAQAQVTVTTDLDPNAIVTGHPAELRQVFTNLLTNAIEASSAGSEISVGVYRNPSGVTVSISDTGSGIPDDIKLQIFQPFYTTKGEAGTGLGLWVAQGILQKHGGQIDLFSNTAATDHGTTVTVTLPRGDAPLRA